MSSMTRPHQPGGRARNSAALIMTICPSPSIGPSAILPRRRARTPWRGLKRSPTMRKSSSKALRGKMKPCLALPPATPSQTKELRIFWLVRGQNRGQAAPSTWTSHSRPGRCRQGSTRSQTDTKEGTAKEAKRRER